MKFTIIATINLELKSEKNNFTGLIEAEMEKRQWGQKYLPLVNLK